MNQLYSNVWRGFGLPLAVLVAILGGGVALIASCALVAELAAALASLLRLRRRQGVPLRDTAGAAAYAIGFLTAGLGLVYLGAPRWGFGLAAGAMLTMLALSIAVAWVAFPGFAQTVMNAIGQKRLPVVPPPVSKPLG